MLKPKALLGTVIVVLAAAFGLIELPENGSLLNSTSSNSTQAEAKSQARTESAPLSASLTSDARIQQAFQRQESDLQVMLAGEVIKNLPDDNQGSRHQKFLFRLNSGQTLLVAHNIDLAPRINNLSEGDTVTLYGEYEWNDRGGVIHWTHHDPRGDHVGGWIEHNGRRYQ